MIGSPECNFNLWQMVQSQLGKDTFFVHVDYGIRRNSDGSEFVFIRPMVESHTRYLVSQRTEDVKRVKPDAGNPWPSVLNNLDIDDIYIFGVNYLLSSSCRSDKMPIRT
jgi:hypothetical protein